MVRHDGKSPLPLGMDWSPPPNRWDGRNTIWPYPAQTGWSYCVTIPSWTIQGEPIASPEVILSPIVFYRVHVGVQSPDGFSMGNEILRRFSEFLKLYDALKKLFTNKNIPKAPLKRAFSGISYSPVLLEKRRNDLEEWIGKLLSDIDVSRSAPVAGFLELEAAARSSFLCLHDHSPETNPAPKVIATSSSTQVLHGEKKNWVYASLAKNELINKCRELHRRLQECSINVLGEEDKSKNITQPFSTDIDFLATSDDQIEVVLAEAQILARDDVEANSDMDATEASGISGNDGDILSTDREIKKVLVDMLIDNARIRKQINYLVRYNLNTTTELEKEHH